MASSLDLVKVVTLTHFSLLPTNNGYFVANMPECQSFASSNRVIMLLGEDFKGNAHPPLGLPANMQVSYKPLDETEFVQPQMFVWVLQLTTRDIKPCRCPSKEQKELYALEPVNM